MNGNKWVNRWMNSLLAWWLERRFTFTMCKRDGDGDRDRDRDRERDDYKLIHYRRRVSYLISQSISG